MLHLLSPKEKKNILREYHLRLVVVTLLFVALLSVVTVALLLPSFFLSDVKENASAGRVAALDIPHATLDEASLKAFDTARRTLSKIQVIGKSLSPSEMFEKILDLRPSGITVSSALYGSGEAGKVGVKIAGTALNRSTLVSYVDAVKATKIFSEVDFPVNNLAQEKDIQFTLEAK